MKNKSLQPINEAHPFLHHYTTKAGLKGILQTQTLFATHFADLNDASEVFHMKQPLIDRLAPVVSELSLESIIGDKKALRQIEEQGEIGEKVSEWVTNSVL